MFAMGPRRPDFLHQGAMGLIAGIISDWVEREVKRLFEHEFVRRLVKQLIELLGIIWVWLVLALAVILVVGLIVWLVAVLASWWWDRELDKALPVPKPKYPHVWAPVLWFLAIVAILYLVRW